MSDEPRPMSQEEIDALFAGLGNPAPEPRPEEADDEATPSADSSADAAAVADEAEDPDAGTGPEGDPLAEDDVDALSAPPPAAASSAADPDLTAASGGMSQSDIDALLGDLNRGGDGGLGAGAGTLGQDQIDQLVEQMQDQPPVPVPDSAASPDSGPMSQSAIDQLLGDINQGGDGGSQESVGAALGQDDIDALVGQMQRDAGQAEPVPEDPDATIAAAMDEAVADTLVADLGGQSAESAAHGTKESEGGALTQSDIDALLAGLDSGEDQSVGTEAVPGVGPATATITPTKIERLMQKQGDNLEDDADISGTGIIAQDDVDALLAQMNEATGAPDAGEIEEALKNREEDIDALLKEADSAGQTAADAVMPSMVSGAPGVSGGVMMATGAAGVMSPEEVRGSKVLLVVAVCLLAMCSVTLILVVQSVNGLTSELRAGRSADEQPADDFAVALDVAQSYLADADPDQVQRGIRYLAKMKRDFDDREDEVALLLARHYRAKGRHDQAWREYQAIENRNESLWRDPSFYLEYADSLMQSGRLAEAEEVIYQLVANQQYFTQAERPDGSRRDPEEVQRHQAAIRRGYVLLGQLYNRHLDSRAVVAAAPIPTEGE